MKYILKTPDLQDPTDVLTRLVEDSLQGGRRKALGEFALLFPEIPTALALDLLDNRATVIAVDGSFCVDWPGPVSRPAEYMHDWKAIAFNTNGNKLEWLETMLFQKDIPTRRMDNPRRPEYPRLEVPIEKAAEASKVFLYRISGRLVRDLRSDNELFAPEGAGWNLDNVDEAGDRHVNLDVVAAEMRTLTPELPEATN